ncbi:hypothetical protein vseg_020826 [Gypsophila vaccaria]
METPVVKSRGRPRKRRREELSSGESQKVGQKVVDDKGFGGSSNGSVREDLKSNGNPRKRGRPPKKRAVEIKGDAMVERYVLKEFGGNGVFLGKIVAYDSGLYRVEYEDGDREDLDSGELREFVIADEQQKFVGEMLERRGKLDEAIIKKMAMQSRDESEKCVKLIDEQKKSLKVIDDAEMVGHVEIVCALEKADLTKAVGRVCKVAAGKALNDVGKIESSTLIEDPSDSYIDDNNNDDSNNNNCSDDDDDDDDSSSCSIEYGQGWETRAETEIPAFPSPELPPSSGTVGVPEEYVSHLFSVYGFLRTFTFHLFLSPFTLDDLVGCLKCKVPNTLLDAIHVALLRTLRLHLESEASEGSLLASKCLRSVDWGLLDPLTWPVYLFHYLMVMGRLDGQEWKGFYVDVLDKDYCTLAIGTKLAVLQILCDDTLDTEEIRTEIDTREESEVGVDPDGIASDVYEGETRKMYPRSSKTLAGKCMDNANSAAENDVLSSNHHKVRDDVGEDGNVDECRLCGMEGMLICCDGCPSAYHSRCIGVNKLSIPDGQWFCPECTISKISPSITLGTSLRGAEVFGMDPYGQLFLGTCNHLLVLKVSVKASPFVRYYNHHDIPKVISVLGSSPYHAVSYLGICQSISKYWELPQVVLSPLITNQASMVLENQDEKKLLPVQFHPSDENMSQPALDKVGNETSAGNVGESSIGDSSGSGNEKLSLVSSPINTVTNINNNHVIIPSSTDDASLVAPVQSDAVQSDPRTMEIAAVKQVASNMTGNPFEHSELSRSTQHGLADRSSVAGIASWASGYNSSIVSGHNNGVCLPETYFILIKGDDKKAVGLAPQKKKDIFLFMGSIFKPYAYINNYVHGAFAAFAAANFAGLSSDEAQGSAVHSTDPRKAMAANIALQVKAFSAAAVRFFWPSTEKKLVEIPRERCSWCLHCTAPVISRKGCLLNQAALTATRAEMKFISALRLVKTVEGGLYGIAAYTLFMEESLQGLLVGPFRSSSYREQWRKKVEQASTCSEMKYLLLDLETNFCTIALSPEWTKFVDNWMDDSSKSQSVPPAGSTQKRGPGKRKKHLAAPEVTVDDTDESTESCWWRGGKLAKLVFQRGTFPRGVLRKIARKGGSKRLPGVNYADGSDVPKRSRQFIWRAAVETAKNASQLALQVRYLDQYIKWSDLVRPEQNPGDGKGPETEAFVFRNAQICGKKILENKIVYGVAFKHQKHLSSRLMKSVIEKEEGKDGEETYWFPEPRVPLYLIKEYEENADKTDVPPAVKPDRYSKHQRRQLKASRKEIFVYLARKKQDLHTCPCASCNGDVLLEQSVTCNSCEGFCHKTCVQSSTELTNEDIEFRITCRKCSQRKNLPQLNISAESPTSPLAMQGQEIQNSAAVAKSGKLRPSGQQHQNSTIAAKNMSSKSGSKQPSVGTLDAHTEKKVTSSESKYSKSKRLAALNCGVIWRKKASDDGSDFRLKNIIFRGSSDGLILSPECLLCHKPYSTHLMYIRCDTCEKWYHADAVKLDESKLSDLIGFKCCRCRRIRSPLCPYADHPIVKKPEVKKLRIKGPKDEKAGASSVSEAISEPVESWPSTPMSMMEMDENVFIDFDDPLVASAPPIEQMPEPKPEVDCEWNDFGPGPQKLPVRRQIKNEKDDDGLTWTGTSSAQLPTSVVNPCIEWEGGLENGIASNYESDFEPQTYFSFTELLEVDGGNKLEGGNDSGKPWEDMSCENSRTGFTEQYNVMPFDVAMPKPSLGPVVNVLCEVCQEAAPAPDLACKNCGIRIHRQCSPWDDDVVIDEDTWNCGQCREWS